jgi:cytochrome c553
MKNYKTYLFLFVFFLLAHHAKSQIVFKDVAQIFYTNCASCHHTGGVQFPLTSYSEIKNQTYAISGDIASSRMPPSSFKCF